MKSNKIAYIATFLFLLPAFHAASQETDFGVLMFAGATAEFADEEKPVMNPIFGALLFYEDDSFLGNSNRFLLQAGLFSLNASLLIPSIADIPGLSLRIGNESKFSPTMPDKPTSDDTEVQAAEGSDGLSSSFSTELNYRLLNGLSIGLGNQVSYTSANGYRVQLGLPISFSPDSGQGFEHRQKSNTGLALKLNPTVFWDLEKDSGEESYPGFAYTASARYGLRLPKGFELSSTLTYMQALQIAEDDGFSLGASTGGSETTLSAYPKDYFTTSRAGLLNTRLDYFIVPETFSLTLGQDLAVMEEYDSIYNSFLVGLNLETKSGFSLTGLLGVNWDAISGGSDPHGNASLVLSKKLGF